MSDEQFVYSLRKGAKKVEPNPLRMFELEEQLQKIIEMDPTMLPGHLITPDAPRRWVLVRREAGVGDEPGGSNWQADHLLLDQDGVPTIVEVKRASSKELRRQVVGQILEYAAHMSSAWPVERLRAWFEQECERASVTPETRLREAFAEPELDVDEYWATVGANLKNGKVRLLIVADEIPGRLRAIVEFLNRAMQDVDLLAVEVRQFVSSDLQIFVPTVFGRIEAVSPSPTPVEVRPEVVGFLGKLRARIVPLYPEGTWTKAPKKILAVTPSAPDGAVVNCKVHFGGWAKDTWSPIEVGLNVTAVNPALREAWRVRLDSPAESFAPGTQIVTSGQQAVDCLKRFEWTDSAELDPDLLAAIAQDVESFAQALDAMLASMSEVSEPIQSHGETTNAISDENL